MTQVKALRLKDSYIYREKKILSRRWSKLHTLKEWPLLCKSDNDLSYHSLNVQECWLKFSTLQPAFDTWITNTWIYEEYYSLQKLQTLICKQKHNLYVQHNINNNVIHNSTTIRTCLPAPHAWVSCLWNTTSTISVPTHQPDTTTFLDFCHYIMSINLYSFTSISLEKKLMGISKSDSIKKYKT